MMGGEDVVKEFHRILQEDGGSLELLSLEGETLCVKYIPAAGEDVCESCILHPDDLRRLVLESPGAQAAGIRRVELVVER